MAEPLREPGWYRLAEHGWERVDDDQALADITAMAPGYQDLTYFETGPEAMAETPLF